MHTPKALFAAVSLSLAAGCLGDWFNLAGGSDYSPAPVELPPSRFPQCLGEPEEVDSSRLAEGEFPTEPSPGVTAYEEVPVSPKGCIRAYQRIVDGKLVGQGLVMALGAVEFFTTPDGAVAFREHERFLSKEVLTDTSSRIEIDDDGDGFIESTMVSSYDDQGLIEQVITFFNPSTGEVEERRTLRRVDPKTIRWIEEKRVDGRLQVTRDQVGPSRMEQAAPIGAGCLAEEEIPPGACTAKEEQRIREMLKKMLEKGAECLAQGKKGPRSGEKDRDLLAHLLRTRAQHLKLTCHEGKKALASIEGIDSQPWGEQTVSMNSGHLRCGTDTQIQSTLFHEMLHITRGDHDGNNEAIKDAIKSGKAPRSTWWYTDSLRACEAFCFGELKNRCSCAACFQTLGCDESCNGQPSCHEQGADGGYVMSDAVGAVCSSGPEGKATWSATMASCRSGCGGTCKSYSVSCNPNCN